MLGFTHAYERLADYRSVATAMLAHSEAGYATSMNACIDVA
jgi:hypothetical protein